MLNQSNDFEAANEERNSFKRTFATHDNLYKNTKNFSVPPTPPVLAGSKEPQVDESDNNSAYMQLLEKERNLYVLQENLKYEAEFNNDLKIELSEQLQKINE